MVRVKKTICPKCKVNPKIWGYCRKCASKLSLSYNRKNNYKNEKTPYQRAIRYIKRLTRSKYPLLNKHCAYCQEPATERHHTTRPITVDNFEYLCHDHHLNAHRRIKEVIYARI